MNPPDFGPEFVKQAMAAGSPAAVGTTKPPAANGRQIIKVGSKGKRWFQIGDREPFEIDAVLVHSLWLEIDRQFRDEKGEVPKDQLQALNFQAIRFVQEVCAPEGQSDTTIDMGEALGFLKVLADVNTEMMPFFVPKSFGEQSSRESTVVTFSE